MVIGVHLKLIDGGISLTHGKLANPIQGIGLSYII
jgi:hypothetical protein